MGSNVQRGNGKVHYSTTPEGSVLGPACGGSRVAEGYTVVSAEVDCKNCLRIMAARLDIDAELSAPHPDNADITLADDCALTSLEEFVSDARTSLTQFAGISPSQLDGADWSAAYEQACHRASVGHPTPKPGILDVPHPTSSGENMAKKPDVDELISNVHDIVDNISKAETVAEVNALAVDAEAIITTVPTKHRTTLRETVRDAKSARTERLEPSAEVATRPTAEVAEDFRSFEDVPELIETGVQYFSEGLELGLKLSEVGEKLAHVMLDVRIRIPNPDTGLPDLMADRKTTKNAASEVYARAKESIAYDDVDRQASHNTLVRATQNKTSDVLVGWLRSFDGPDREASLSVAAELFGDRLEVADGESISEAVYALYARHGIELPRYGRTELARYDRRVKAIETARRELETAQYGEDATERVAELEEKIKDLSAEVPAEVLAAKLGPVTEKSDADRALESLDAIKGQLQKAGKRFAKVKSPQQKQKAKAELYSIIRNAANTFELDLSALVAVDDEDA